jgi:hypothetical protein
MATIIRRRVQDTLGKEAGLAVTGRAFLAAGIVAALGGIGLAAATGRFAWMWGGLACLVFGAVFHVVFGALSEIIILLKRLCGLPCSAQPSGTASGEIFLCSECGCMVYATSEKCPRCGEPFDGPDAKKEAVSAIQDISEKEEVP